LNANVKRWSDPNDLDDLPIFRPRMGAGRKSPSRSAAGSFRNALLSRITRSARTARRHIARSRVAVPRPDANARRVVVKVHVARLGAGGAKAAALHLRYIERDGVEKDGSKGVAYTADGPARVETFEQPRSGERHQFRLMVSPEDAKELDLTEYVRRFMARVERDLGRKLEWLAVNHFDTAHPHAHIVIRGVDRSGRELRLDRGFISNGLRGIAQQIATEELGPRNELDIRRAYAREITQERFTSLDRELERRAVDHGIEVRSRQRPGRIDDSTLVARLEHLEAMRLAERVSPSTWSLQPGWQAELRALGSRGDIVKQLHAAVRGDPARYRIVAEGEALEPGLAGDAGVVSGRVAHKGLSDELRGRLYAVIETPAGHAVHVPLDARSAEDLHPGDIVTVTSQPERAIPPVDRHIADVARARAGVYTLDADAADATARAAGGRLRELERLGLATPAGPDAWTLPPDLLDRLEARHRAVPPKHRLFFRKEPLSLAEQIRYRGPVWLDRVDASTSAPYGFGAELRHAVEGRAETLRKLGIEPDDPSRLAALRERERRTVGEHMAASLRQTFVGRVPERFRGRVEIHVAPGGFSYAVISDGSRFGVMETRASLRALRGKSVVLARDSKGRLVVRPDLDRGLGR
jgi:type IV secretory pathway VirD2 relaxase